MPSYLTSSRWRARYIAVIVGVHSGSVTRVPFIMFTTLAKGEAWCRTMDRKNEFPGTRWEVRPINDDE